MKRPAVLLLVLLAGCASSDPNSDMDHVRITSNPELVRQCEFKGIVRISEDSGREAVRTNVGDAYYCADDQ